MENNFKEILFDLFLYCKEYNIEFSCEVEPYNISNFKINDTRIEFISIGKTHARLQHEKDGIIYNLDYDSRTNEWKENSVKAI